MSGKRKKTYRTSRAKGPTCVYILSGRQWNEETFTLLGLIDMAMTEQQLETQLQELERGHSHNENLRALVAEGDQRSPEAFNNGGDRIAILRTLGLVDDPTGAAANCVEQYLQIDRALKNLERRLSHSMIVRKDDIGHLSSCYAAHTQAVKSAHNKKRDVLAAWVPDFRQRIVAN
jgi:hypothetical protein